LTAAQQTLMATFLNQYSAPPTGGGSCTSCHGQPPAGSSSPDQAGAHGVHTTLNGIGTDCANCHAGAAHNSVVDRGISSTWNAKSGIAIGNTNGTCSNISCHGGVATPNWITGSINVDTQCTSCHTAGTSQYNGYVSGRHDKHVREKKISCTQCHDTNRLRNGHFVNLSSSSFEQAPAATIKSSLGYAGGSCSTASCHGPETWRDDD
jgi:predicted CxxxxCH...CXXCH cytochrome family protein